MVSRKKATGKARKAAKAKAKEDEGNIQTSDANGMQQALLEDLQQFPCEHGVDLLSLEAFDSICLPFVTATAFTEKYGETTIEVEVELVEAAPLKSLIASIIATH